MRKCIAFQFFTFLFVFVSCQGSISYGSDQSADEEVKNLTKEIRRILLSEPDTGCLLVTRALKLAEKKKLPDTVLSDLYYLKGIALFYTDSIDASIISFDSALNSAARSRAGFFLAKAHLEKSRPLQARSELQAACYHLEKAVYYFDSLGNIPYSANASTMLGSIYNEQGYYEKAIKTMVKAYNAIEHRGDPRVLSALCSNISNSFGAIGDNSEAVLYTKKALELAESVNDTFNIAVTLCNLGIRYKTINPDSAVVFFEKASELTSRFGTQESRLSSLYNLANVELDRKNLQKAELLFDSILRVSTESQMPKGIAMALFGKASVASERGQIAQFTTLMSRAVTIADSFALGDLSLQFTQKLYEVYVQRGYSTLAQNAIVELLELKDSLAMADQINAVHTIEKKFQVARREMEISRLQEEASWHQYEIRTIKIFTLLCLLSATILGLFVWFYARMNKKVGAAYRRLMDQYDEFIRRHTLEQTQKTPQLVLNNTSPAQIFVKKLHEHLQAERAFLNPGLKVEQVAETLGVSYYTINSALKEVEGCTFNKLINRYRVDATIQMFKHPDYDVMKTQAIGQEAGFGSVNTFYLAFQEVTGVPPSQYRKLLKEQQ